MSTTKLQSVQQIVEELDQVDRVRLLRYLAQRISEDVPLAAARSREEDEAAIAQFRRAQDMVAAELSRREENTPSTDKSIGDELSESRR
ncbi:MAG TPA: hypothetical protein VEA69_06580 [Tepidisphaeraceae bacterium]|nr:hypothetical protein [Tepidisphaeraceae bacterium]